MSRRILLFMLAIGFSLFGHSQVQESFNFSNTKAYYQQDEIGMNVNLQSLAFDVSLGKSIISNGVNDRSVTGIFNNDIFVTCKLTMQVEPTFYSKVGSVPFSFFGSSDFYNVGFKEISVDIYNGQNYLKTYKIANLTAAFGKGTAQVSNAETWTGILNLNNMEEVRNLLNKKQLSLKNLKFTSSFYEFEPHNYFRLALQQKKSESQKQEFIEQARQAEARGDLDQAIENYSAASKLDREDEELKSKINQIEEKVKQQAADNLVKSEEVANNNSQSVEQTNQSIQNSNESDLARRQEEARVREKARQNKIRAENQRAVTSVQRTKQSFDQLDEDIKAPIASFASGMAGAPGGIGARIGNSEKEYLDTRFPITYGVSFAYIGGNEIADNEKNKSMPLGTIVYGYFSESATRFSGEATTLGMSLGLGVFKINEFMPSIGLGYSWYSYRGNPDITTDDLEISRPTATIGVMGSLGNYFYNFDYNTHFGSFEIGIGFKNN